MIFPVCQLSEHCAYLSQHCQEINNNFTEVPLLFIFLNESDICKLMTTRTTRTTRTTFSRKIVIISISLREFTENCVHHLKLIAGNTYK